MPRWHPRLSLNAICSMSQSLDEDIALWAELGVDHVALITPKIEAVGWEAGIRKVKDAGLRVSNVSCYKHGMAGSIEFTAAVGADILYLPPGSGGSRLWEEAAAQFAEDMAPWVARAKELGVTIGVEPTNPLRTDVSFLHTFRDAVDLARNCEMSVVIDYYSTWYERGLEELVRKHIDVVGLVQISEYKLGTFDMPNRPAIGDGDIPVERLTALLLEAGYDGPFDLEIMGPPVESEGYRSAITRSLERASELLGRLGA